MATGTYAPDPDLHVVDANGVIVSGGLVWTYLAGTTTPTPTYSDVTLLVPNTNPIVAGSDGRFVAFLAGGLSYKFVYEMPAIPPAHGAVLATRDNILAVTTLAPGSGGAVTQTTALTGTVNDFALISGCAVLYCANPVTITGFAGGTLGQRLTVVAHGGPVNLPHNSSSSLVGNRLLNWDQTTVVCGTATYVYSGTSWEMVARGGANPVVTINPATGAIALDASQGTTFFLYATGDCTVGVPTNAVDGQKIIIRFVAIGGPRTLTLTNWGGGGVPGAFRFSSAIPSPLPQSPVNTTDYVGCCFCSSFVAWDVVAYIKGF